MGMEIEVKFYVDNVDKVHEKLQKMGAQSDGSVFESNIRYDTREKSLMKNHCLLRLRKDVKNTLTFKSAGDQTEGEDREFKILREIEVEVNDFQALDSILQHLGYEPVQIYEKYRETFTLGKTVICIDEMPFGVFLEIEGEKQAIKDVARDLGLPWEKRILHNYLMIFEKIKKEASFSFADITFDNFCEIEFDITKILPELMAEDSLPQ